MTTCESFLQVHSNRPYVKADLFSVSYQRQSGTKITKTSATLAAEAHDAAMQGQALFNLKDSHKVCITFVSLSNEVCRSEVHFLLVLPI